MAPVRYRSPDEDSGRWDGFAFRPGDIVISTRSKHGTTWLQMICALLVFQTADLPAPLVELSPWLDWLGEPRDDVVARLDAQPHRRILKTHTPLDGLPRDPCATFVVVARHPLDAAVSLYHQGGNLDRDRMAALTGSPRSEPMATRPSLHDWLVDWVEQDPTPHLALDSLPGVMHHLAGAWERRSDPDVVLVHYDDLLVDLGGEMARLADRLGIVVDDQRVPDLVPAATFPRMQANAARLAPDASGVLRDRSRFFRRGRSGEGAAVLTAPELQRYHDRASALAPADLLGWLHRGGRA